jgi:hypothetical protein
VSFLSAAKLRRLVPAGAVAAVLTLSYLAPLPSEASNGVGGFGYNCGVKGYGYHDHGKPCPNRPFPGKGTGLAEFGINVTTPRDDITTTASEESSTTSSVESDDSIASQENAPTSTGAGHGHGQSHSQGKGQ